MSLAATERALNETRIGKLPVWARSWIRGLQSDVRQAEYSLESIVDKENALVIPDWHNASFYNDDMVGGGKPSIRRHFVAPSITCVSHGVRLDISPTKTRLRLFFGSVDHGDDVAICPEASNLISLRPVNR